MIVVGTAGHIDHGKSSIVKRLTGTDPDRLPEEKARGMTIDLGFAFYRTSAGEEIAFVDVPGHERFVRNMIAGAGGIDAAMLVVAADDGWMPQSEEHFAILKLLQIPSGFIVINKCDLAEKDWLDLLEQDIRGRVRGTFLAEAPILRISAETGDGFDALRAHLENLPAMLAHRNWTQWARLCIDRSFVQAGIGGVVTGTLRGKPLRAGQAISVWPASQTGKIRTLQTHGTDVEEVNPGFRTAVSITGIDKEHLVRGGVVTDRLDLSHFSENPILAVSIELLRDAAVPLEDRRRILMLVGTSEVEGELRLLESDAIRPGQRGIAFIKPDSPLFCLVGDRFIVRLPSPAVTLGGGMIVDHLPRFPRRRDLDELSYLKSRAAGDTEQLVLSELAKRPFTKRSQFLENAEISSEQAEAQLERLTKAGHAGGFGDYVYSPGRLESDVEKVKERLTVILSDKSHVKGLSIDELLGLIPSDRISGLTLIEYLVAQGILVRAGDKLNLAGRGMTLKGVVREAHDKILGQLQENRYAPPALATLAAQGKPYQEAIKYILDSGEGYKCGSEFLVLTEVWEEVVGYIRERLTTSGSMTVGDLKDRFGFSRKYAIPILEETDRIKLTRREGDVRKKGDRFEG